jgi:hypothetical protein
MAASAHRPAQTAATFEHPAEAIRAAVAIAGDVHELGLAVRSGIHTGECELIDGKLGGIAVHIGARVMALAGPAEILVTGTVRELVAGSGMTFEEHGAHELKGVPGTWNVHALQEVDGEPSPAPLSPSEALVRLAAVSADAGPRRRRRFVLGAVALALLVAAITVPLLAFGGRTHAASGGGPVSVVRIDPVRSRVASTVRDHAVAQHEYGRLWIVNGTLWQQIRPKGVELVRRDVHTGRIEQTISLPSDAVEFAFGFGSIWVLRSVGPDAQNPGAVVVRVDQLSGRPLKAIRLRSIGLLLGQATIATGGGGVWVLNEGGGLTKIDPLTNRVVGTYKTGAIETTTLIPLKRYAWICECVNSKVLRFDELTHATRTFTIPEHAVLAGVVEKRKQTLWLLDSEGATLTPMNPSSGATGQPLGLSGQPQQGVIAFGAIWAAAGRVLDRVDLGTRTRSTIAMPAGVWAGSIAADPGSGALWIGSDAGPPPVQRRP